MAARILIADDNGDDAALLQQALRDQAVDLTIHVVAEGDAVLAEFRNYPGIELVILDYYLPRKTATEVVEQLRQARVMPACPVVVLTSHVPPSLRDALLAAGVKTVIYKPVDWDGFVELADQLHSMLRGVKPSARSESQAE